jgi:non-ribosomal peptide synthase protein (TIGR01720 family)
MARAFPLTPEDRVLQKTPISFDASVWEFWAPLLAGARLVMVAVGGHRDPAHLVRAIRQQGITIIQLVPSLLQMLLEEEQFSDCRSLRRVFCGGEALTRELQDGFFARFEDGPSLHNLYGPTEAAIDATSFTCRRGWDRSAVPIGRPIANMEAFVLDAKCELVPAGVPGELYLGGAGLSTGYLGRPELTRERFVPHPFRPGAILYRTGDLVRYLSDGNLEFLGRIDDQVKLRGFRIELGEIESALRQHPAIGEAAVVAREDRPGEKRLAAYLVPRSGAISTSELREHLTQKLPEYMVPGAFVTLEALPLTPNGKLDRKALPAPGAGSSEAEFAAPQSAAEETLAKIWSDVLRVKQVGIHDNFFELGGDSILSIQIIARANQAGLRLTPKQVFQHQSIASLAAIAGSEAVAQADQGTVTGAVPLTPIQRWFFEQELEEPHHFNLVRILELAPQVTAEQAELALEALVRHHDALRLRFQHSEAGWQQSNAAREENEFFSVVELGRSHMSDMSDAADWLPALTAKAGELQASLSLESGPLLRAGYFRLGEQESPRLLIVIHHLAVDAVSWRVLLEDLQSALGQLSRGEEIALPPKTTSFQQWANRLVEFANSEELQREAGYWLNTERDPIRPLPVDFRGAENTVASQRIIRRSLSEEETRALLTEAPSAYHTQINDLLLCALAQAFSSWTGARALLVELEGHGREALFEEVDPSRTVGWFTSMYPLFLELPAGKDPGAAIKSVKEQLRSVPNRGIGYGVLRYLAEDEKVRRCLAEQPGAEVSFNYLGQFGAANRQAGDRALFSPARESAGATQSPRQKRTHALDILGTVTGEKLQISWIYSDSLHCPETIERLAEDFLSALRSLTDHCRSGESGGFTPSDFPDAEIDQKSLDRLLASISK